MGCSCAKVLCNYPDQRNTSTDSNKDQSTHFTDNNKVRSSVSSPLKYEEKVDEDISEMLKEANEDWKLQLACEILQHDKEMGLNVGNYDSLVMQVRSYDRLADKIEPCSSVAARLRDCYQYHHDDTLTCMEISEQYLQQVVKEYERRTYRTYRIFKNKKDEKLKCHLPGNLQPFSEE